MYIFLEEDLLGIQFFVRRFGHPRCNLAYCSSQYLSYQFKRSLELVSICGVGSGLHPLSARFRGHLVVCINTPLHQWRGLDLSLQANALSYFSQRLPTLLLSLSLTSLYISHIICSILSKPRVFIIMSKLQLVSRAMVTSQGQLTLGFGTWFCSSCLVRMVLEEKPMV